ncbi:MAG: alkaline phosphatase family protein, partial [Candidatus Magasanikbacteria bacterium]|nr:alkaline phosphatase family protein [Candidatus Magasanikbacteria bacterium]
MSVTKKNELVMPDYDGACLSAIPQLILSIFGHASPPRGLEKFTTAITADHKKVVFFLIDGLGYAQLERWLPECPFFTRLQEKNSLHQITTVFPSTTAAAVSTIHTGLTPQEHGLFEWRIYFPAIDDVAMTLPFTRRKSDGDDSLAREGVSNQNLLQAKTIYETLLEKQIPAFVFKPKTFADSAYSQRAHRGATTVTYINMSDMLANLVKKMTTIAGPAYYLVYWSGLDTIAHAYGPHTPQYRAELRTISHLLQHEWLDLLPAAAARETLFLLTADHGQLGVELNKTIYISNYPEIMTLLARRKNGEILLPWGSPRDMFMRAAPGKKPTLLAMLKSILSDQAEILDTAEMMRHGLFGRGETHPEWAERLGDVAILANDNHVIWYESDRTEPVWKPGQHGGLSAAEMLIQF